MSRKRVDPFSNDSTPKATPSKGTGLSTGTAGERRAGNPRTESERATRHEVMDDSSNSGEYVKTIIGKKAIFIRKGYKIEDIPPPESRSPPPESRPPKPKTLSEQWAEHRKKE